MATKIEKIEFQFEDGVHIVWTKEGGKWTVTRYKHNEMGRHIVTVGHLPTITNAKYFYELLR